MQDAIMITVLLKRLNTSIRTIVSRELAGVGLTYPQATVLKQLEDGPKTIGQISQALHFSHSTVSGIIDRLERNGWVERKRCHKDRRVVWIRQTENVVKIKQQIPVFQDDYFRFLVENLNENERKTIIEALQLLNRQLIKKEEEQP